MNAIFLQSGYVLKRQGLAIAAKYRLTGLQGEPLLFIEEKIKWIPPSTSVHMYADEKKTREVLTFKDGKSADVGTDIFDAESGQKIGGIGTTADNLAEFIKDAWVIVDAEDKPVAKVAERSTGQSIARELLSHDLPQQLDIKRSWRNYDRRSSWPVTSWRSISAWIRPTCWTTAWALRQLSMLRSTRGGKYRIAKALLDTQMKHSGIRLLTIAAISAVILGCSSQLILPFTRTPTATPIPPTSTPAAPLLTIRLMAYNIWFGAGVNPAHIERGDNLNRLADLIALVKQVNPDIMGLEEVTDWTSGNPTTIEQFARAENMNYYMADTWRGINPAIFSKYPILETENLSEYVGNNGALRAVVQAPNGQKLNVVIVHLDPRDPFLRSCEFDKLRRVMEAYTDQPGILMGDINTGPYSADARYLTDGGWELVQSEGIDNIYTFSHLAWSAEPMCFSTDATKAGCFLDTRISDHKPVGAVLSFYGNQNPRSLTVAATPSPVAKCDYARTPAQTPNDTFDGTSLDETKWRPVGSGGSASQEDRLILTTASEPASSSARIQSRWQLEGDFDIQVDFQIDPAWSAPTNDHLDGAYFGVTIDGQDYHITRLRRMDGGNANVFFAWSSNGAVSGEVNTDALAGKYRLVRSGTTLSLQYDIGAGWVELVSGSVPADPAYVYMGNGSVNASQAFTTYFDNFLINSGSPKY